jgi:hypothetical protein
MCEEMPQKSAERVFRAIPHVNRPTVIRLDSTDGWEEHHRVAPRAAILVIHADGRFDDSTSAEKPR